MLNEVALPDWIDYNEVAFPIERWGQKIMASRDLKIGISTMKKLLPFYIQVNKCVTSF